MKKAFLLLFGMLLCVYGCSGKSSEELFREGVKELEAGNTHGAMVLLKSVLQKNEKHVEARFQLGRAYMLAGKYEQAEKEFEKVQRLNPSQHGLHFNLARLYNLQNLPDQALPILQRLLETNPRSIETMEEIGIACAAKERFAEAESHLLKVLEADPARVPALLALAGVYTTQKKVEMAKDALSRLQKIDPSNSKSLYMLAGLEMSQGHSDEALKIYERIAVLHASDPVAPYKAGLIRLENGELATAKKIADELVKKFPKKSEGYRLKGIVDFRNQNRIEAIAALQHSIKLHQSVEGYYYLGLCHYYNDELEMAMSQFRVLLDRFPTFNQSRLMVGLIHLRQNRIDDAITELKTILKADDRNAMAHNLLGSAYMAKGMYDQGMSELNAATVLDPSIVDAHLKKGVLHLSRGLTGEVETDLKAAVQGAPEILNTRLILSSFYMQKKDAAKALAVLREGLKGTNADSPLYAWMAKIMFAGNRQQEGLQYLLKAREMNQEATGPRIALADYYVKAGELSKGVQEYQGVLQKDPSNFVAMLRLALLLESKGRTDDALSYYNKAKATGEPEAFIALATYYSKRNEGAKALAVLQEGRKVNTRNADILEMSGKLQLKERMYHEALSTFDELEAISTERAISLKSSAAMTMNDYDQVMKQADRALAHRPSSSFGHVLRASVYRQQKNLQRAISELREGIKKDGNNRARLMLADLYSQTGDLPKALKSCEDIIRDNPRNAAAHFAHGNFLEAAGKKQEAVKKYQAALSINEKLVPALNNLASLYCQGYGPPGEALKLAESALALEPDNAAVMITMGEALLKNNRSAEARTVLEKAARHLPNNPSANYYLAVAYKGTGDKGRAVASLKKALAGGEFAEARQAKTLLSQLN